MEVLGEGSVCLAQLTRLVAIVLSSWVLCLPVTTSGLCSHKAQAAAESAYPESAEGLKNLLQDAFVTVKAGDETKFSAFVASFVIPNHREWFPKMFGTSEGALLEGQYSRIEAQSAEWLKKRIELNVKESRTELTVKLVGKPDDTSMPLMRAVAAALAQPNNIYMVSVSTGPDDKSPHYLGDFVYVKAGFRYLDRQVLQALSTAPPMRIKVGGNVARERLIKKIQPKYPPEASAQRIAGTVKLEVVIGRDGTIQEVHLVSGHPLLAQPAIDAVKQWIYQLTLLNGQPVEVATEIDVIFSL